MNTAYCRSYSTRFDKCETVSQAITPINLIGTRLNNKPAKKIAIPNGDMGINQKDNIEVFSRHVAIGEPV
jgi:hypothetical protein